MKVSDILSSKGNAVSTIPPDVRVGAVVARFNEEHIGSLVVTDPAGAMVGLIAERDIVRALGERDGDLFERRVRDVMHRQPATCAPDDDIKSVMRTMTQRRLRHLPVLQASALVGMVSIGDVVKHRLDEMELEANVLRDIYIANR